MGGKCFAYYPANGAMYRQWSAETLCNRNIREAHRRRLEIEQWLEDHLRDKKQLTSQRLRAINQARFQIARQAWQYDPSLTARILDQVLTLEPKFSPKGAGAPLPYQLAYHFLGFQATERLAAAVRKGVGRLPSLSLQ
jgi:hypothetical protein